MRSMVMVSMSWNNTLLAYESRVIALSAMRSSIILQFSMISCTKNKEKLFSGLIEGYLVSFESFANWREKLIAAEHEVHGNTEPVF